ncbi:MAG: hypothetical protein ABIP03_12485, partial [Aquihabitans sp.]
HRQARQGLTLALGFVAVAPLAAVVPHHTGVWLPLHLFLVGGMVGTLSAVTQMLAITWSSSPPPVRWLAAAQRWSLALGTVAVAVGRERNIEGLTGAGGAAVVAALVLLAVILAGIRRTAVTFRYLPAIDAYLLAAVAGLVGGSLGTALATGHVAAENLVAFRNAHLSVNIFGLVGMVAAGTLPFFSATQIRSRMAPWATSGRIRAVVLWLTAATVVMASGHLVKHPAVAAGGLAAYAVGIGAVVALCPRVTRRQVQWAGPRLWQLAAGVAWWLAMTLVLAVQFATGRGYDGPVLRALAVGGYAQILVASLAYLGPVLHRGGNRTLAGRFALTRSWGSLVAGNVAAACALADASVALAAVLGIWLVVIAARAVRLFTGDKRPTPLPAGGD